STPSEASRSDRTRRLGTLTTGSVPFITTSDEIRNNKRRLLLLTTPENRPFYRTLPFTVKKMSFTKPQKDLPSDTWDDPV
ncbi:unnamed protein product, partial [Adineta ricciae]